MCLQLGGDGRRKSKQRGISIVTSCVCDEVVDDDAERGRPRDESDFVKPFVVTLCSPP